MREKTRQLLLRLCPGRMAAEIERRGLHVTVGQWEQLTRKKWWGQTTRTTTFAGDGVIWRSTGHTRNYLVGAPFDAPPCTPPADGGDIPAGVWGTVPIDRSRQLKISPY